MALRHHPATLWVLEPASIVADLKVLIALATIWHWHHLRVPIRRRHHFPLFLLPLTAALTVPLQFQRRGNGRYILLGQLYQLRRHRLESSFRVLYLQAQSTILKPSISRYATSLSEMTWSRHRGSGWSILREKIRLLISSRSNYHTTRSRG